MAHSPPPKLWYLPNHQGASVTLHIIILGVGGTIYNTHTLKPFKELGLDPQRVKKLVSTFPAFSLTYDSSVTTRAHVLHLGFLKKLLGVKKGTDTHCVLREIGQMPIFFYWFRCTIRFWNSLLSSNNPLLEKIVRADLLLAHRSDTWTYQVMQIVLQISQEGFFETES